MKNKLKKSVWIVLACLCAVVFIVSTVFLMLSLHGKEPDVDVYTNPSATEPTGLPAPTDPDQPQTPTEAELGENPRDFAALVQENKDICAWIRVPGTPIDYPIVRHDEIEEYYLRRDYLGNPSVSGCIFIQNLNARDFSDPNTVVYGHYMFDHTFFGSLHDFRDPDFFAENDCIYIYTPGHVLIYEIFAAYEYDNRHILKSFDMHDEQAYAAYQQTCLAPHTMEFNVRDGVTLSPTDRIITLSTCVQNSDLNKRYLVQGVLRSDQPTK